MALKETIQRMKVLLTSIAHNLDKAATGNKAAAQRARTETIRFAKIAKIFRQESVKAAKSGQKKAERAEKAKKTTSKKTHTKNKSRSHKKKK